MSKPTWSVSIPWYAAVIVEVKADTEKEAIIKAEDIAYPSLCHQCTKTIELGEFDPTYPSTAYKKEKL